MSWVGRVSQVGHEMSSKQSNFRNLTNLVLQNIRCRKVCQDWFRFIIPCCQVLEQFWWVWWLLGWLQICWSASQRPCCLGYRLYYPYYPVIYSDYNKPRSGNPYETTRMMESRRVFFPCSPDIWQSETTNWDHLELVTSKVTVVAKACREQEPPPATATKYAEVACNEGEARSVLFNFMAHV